MIAGRFLSDKKQMGFLAFLLAVSLNPLNLVAQSVGVEVHLAGANAPAGLSSPSRLGAQNTDFSMFPSVTSSSLSPYGAGPQRLNLVTACVDLFSRNILPNCDVQLFPNARAGSGGHVHNTDRPRGTFNPDHGNTGPSGFLAVTYTSPEASGVTTVTEVGFLNGIPVSPGIFTIGVEFDGLELASGDNLIIDTASQMHDNNNGFASPDMIGAIGSLFGDFSDQLAKSNGGAAPAIEFTALSLPLGGLFDFQTEWHPPHVSHRFGNDGDIAIRNLTRTQRRALAKTISDDGFTTPVPGERPQDPNASHWHIRLN